MTDFNAWSHENLVKFAQVATTELQYLRDELKTAIKAYRELNTTDKDHEKDTFNSFID